MNRIIFHFELKPGENKFRLPLGSNIVMVGERPSCKTPRIWVDMPTDKRLNEEVRIFYLYMTGERFSSHPHVEELANLPRSMPATNHIGSFVMSNGLVYHCYSGHSEIVRKTDA